MPDQPPFIITFPADDFDWQCCVYAFYEPGDESARVRYVGATQNHVATRVAGHLSEARRYLQGPRNGRLRFTNVTRVTAWIASLLDEGKVPHVGILELAQDFRWLLKLEADWIDRFAAQGQADLNDDGRTARKRRWNGAVA